MNKSKSMSSSLAIALIIRMFFLRGLEVAAVFFLIILIILSMIWFKEFWVNYVLRFMRFAPMATDFRNPSGSGVAIVLIGWILLIILSIYLFLQ